MHPILVFLLQAVFVTALAALVTWFMFPALWARGIILAGRIGGGLRSNETDVGDVHWHWLEGGHGPPLVVLHGFGADADHWVLVSRGLGRHFRVLAPDLPGHGDSMPGEHLGYSARAQAQRVAEWLDALGIERCILAGNSMGGWVAATLAAEQPERVRALWLLAPLGVQAAKTSDVLRAIDEGLDSPLEFQSVAEFRERVMRPMFAHHPRLPMPLLTWHARRARARRELLNRVLDEVRHESEPLEDLAARIRCPVLLHWGRDDQVTDPSGCRPLCEAIPGCDARELEKCGHLPMLERPVRTQSDFLDFAGQHELFTDTEANTERADASL